MADQIKGDVQAALDAGALLNEQSGTQALETQFAFLPAGATVVDLERFFGAPRRIVQALNFDEVPSFISYVNRFKGDSTTIFCNQKSLSFCASLDYHRTPGQPAWCTHTASLKLMPSDSWAAWCDNNLKKMDQQAFAEFIENHYRDVQKPDAATMLEIALGFEAKKDVNFSSGIRLENGQIQFTYNETVGASSRSGALEVPSKFEIHLPVLKGAAPQTVTLRLRYRLKESELGLWYEIMDLDQINEQAFNKSRDLIRSLTSIGPLSGVLLTGGKS